MHSHKVDETILVLKVVVFVVILRQLHFYEPYIKLLFKYNRFRIEVDNKFSMATCLGISGLIDEVI